VDAVSGKRVLGVLGLAPAFIRSGVMADVLSDAAGDEVFPPRLLNRLPKGVYG
jgi:hypothetical protein